MFVTLHYREHVAEGVLLRHVPRGLLRVALAADADARALPQRVEHKAVVAAEDAAFGRADLARLGRQVLAQELGETPLADEADPGTVFLVMVGETGLPGQRPRVGLEGVSQREQRTCQCRLGYRVQEVT